MLNGQKERKPLTAVSIAQLVLLLFMCIYALNVLVGQHEKFSTFVINAVSIMMFMQH